MLSIFLRSRLASNAQAISAWKRPSRLHVPLIFFPPIQCVASLPSSPQSVIDPTPHSLPTSTCNFLSLSTHHLLPSPLLSSVPPATMHSLQARPAAPQVLVCPLPRKTLGPLPWLGNTPGDHGRTGLVESAQSQIFFRFPAFQSLQTGINKCRHRTSARPRCSYRVPELHVERARNQMTRKTSL